MSKTHLLAHKNNSLNYACAREKNDIKNIMENIANNKNQQFMGGKECIRQ